MDPAQIHHAIDQLISDCNALKEMVCQDRSLQPLDDFETLKKMLYQEQWPEAVNKNLICNYTSEADKTERGRIIIELMIEENIRDSKFLDFGCGEGHVAAYGAESHASKSVGYDTKTYKAWRSETKPNLIFTTDYTEVQENGPYDIILIFDVIDHLESDTPVGVLQKAASALKPSGKIYMRAHPFASRHACHHYHDLNKAYIHLVFSEKELSKLLPEAKYRERNTGVVYPLTTYRKYIQKAGLRIISERPIKQTVEPLFKSGEIARRIKMNCATDKFPEFQLSLQFVDYVLAKPQLPVLS